MCSILNFLFSPPCPQGTDQVARQHNRSMSRRRFYHLYRVSSQFSAFSSIFFFNSTSPVQPISSSCPHNWSMSGRRFDPLYRGVPSQPTAAFQFTFYFCHNYLPQPPSFTNTNTLLPSNSLFTFTTITKIDVPCPQIQKHFYFLNIVVVVFNVCCFVL